MVISGNSKVASLSTQNVLNYDTVISRTRLETSAWVIVYVVHHVHEAHILFQKVEYIISLFFKALYFELIH